MKYLRGTKKRLNKNEMFKGDWKNVINKNEMFKGD